MGLFAKRHDALQGPLWAFFGLIQLCTANQTLASIPNKELSDSGKEALIVICLGLVSLSIVSISAHYCNFELRKKSYKRLDKESELVEINLDESDEEP
jgi:hypothetical protein